MQIAGTVYSNEDGSQIKGAKVTIVEGAAAKEIQADDKGGYAFMACPQATIFFRAEAADFYPMLRGIVVPEAGALRDWYLPARATIEGSAQLVGEELKPEKGMLWVSFENATAAGYSAKLTAAHGATVTLDPDSKQPTKASETLSGGLDFWFLIFANTDVGKTQIELVTPAGHACKPRTTVKDWRVDAQTITYVDVDCD